MNSTKIPFKNILSITAYVIFGIFILYFFIYFFNYHYHIITCPYPLEYREGASMVSTELLVEGKNPFDISNIPQYTNVYGVFNNLLLFPFAKIWGASILLHRIASGFFIFASCLLIVAVLRKDKLPFLLSCAGGVLFYPFLLFPSTMTPIAGPHSLGTFLFLMTFYVPYLFNYSKTSLGVSIFLGILAFYTKEYFLLGVPLTALYIFLFKSKKKGILYGIVFLIVFTLSIYAANHAMNCYFNNVFFLCTTLDLSLNSAIEQLKYFYQLQKPLFFLLGTCFIIQRAIYIKNFKNKPLKWDFNIHFYTLIITTLLIYFILGRNLGQFMGYLFQLMSPFFILYVFNCLYKYPFTTYAGMALIVINLFTLSSNFPKNFHEFDKNWQAVDSLIAANENIFASPIFAPLLLKYHRPVYDSGHSEYFQDKENQKFLNIKLPIQQKVQDKADAEWVDVRNMMVQKRFDFMIILPNYHPFLSNDWTLYYRPVGIIKLNMFHFPNEFCYYLVLAPK